jgi:hypothetical protein
MGRTWPAGVQIEGMAMASVFCAETRLQLCMPRMGVSTACGSVSNLM